MSSGTGANASPSTSVNSKILVQRSDPCLKHDLNVRLLLKKRDSILKICIEKLDVLYYYLPGGTRILRPNAWNQNR